MKIISASWHRNGVAGKGFYAVLFDDDANGMMIASLFDKPGYCAVYNVEQLNRGNIAFARGNSWRGDFYESKLRPLLEEFIKNHRGNRLGDFSMIPPDVLDAEFSNHVKNKEAK